MAILAGILVGTSYIPFPPWAIFFCFLPLWNVWIGDSQLSLKQIFWTGWITQFVLTLIGFNWVSYTVHEFGHMPWPLATLALCAFCAFANLQIPLAGVAWAFVSRALRLDEKARIFLLAVFFCIGFRVYPMIFDWHFGYTWLWAGFKAYQLADIIGFIGLNDIGLLFNALLLIALRERFRRGAYLRWFLPVPFVFVLLNVLGWVWEKQLPMPDSKASFLVVQANIGNQEKMMAEEGWAFRDKVIERFASLTRQGLNSAGSADFVVWPETAFPEIVEDPYLSRGYPLRLKEIALSTGTRLITGGYSRMASNDKVTNSFFVLDKSGHWVGQPYHKTVLLAFGEYMPLGDTFPKLHDWIPETGDFGRGPGPTVMNSGLEGVRLGVQICYEGLFDWFTRSLALQGANILINVTNDSWYGKSSQPWQHGWMTLARAIEVRRPLVRSTNTGISTVILASGEILELSPLHEEWFHLYEVPYVRQAPTTLFMGWGYYLMPCLLGVFLIFLLRRRERANDKS